jgi:hypothetical protein
MAYFAFNADQAVREEGEGSFDPIPEGWYQVTILDAPIKAVKNKPGEYINLKLLVSGPSHANRIVFAKLNVRNANPDAERIAHLQLGDILRATGISGMEDTDQLIDRRLEAKVVIKPATSEFAASNDVKAYRAIGAGNKKAKNDGDSPTSIAPKPAPKPASSENTPPWGKK